MDRMNIPNPGSDEAVKRGCKCPIMDNHYGEGVFFNGAFQFWMAMDCPLHGQGTAYMPDEDWIVARDIL